MKIDGAILIGGGDRQRQTKFHGTNPATGETIGPAFSEANSGDVSDACTLAAKAAKKLESLAPEVRAAFLEAVGDAILAIGANLIETAMAETGLPRARLESERGRTANQLGMFANEVRKGEWLDATIDPALPDRVPPRPDLRRMNVPVGPVAVFGASNFPLAFSVAGGDTASAFAAGCPVIVKGHPAHPGTGELVARAIRSAVAACDLPEGVFSYLPGRSNELGAALVSNPHIKAVGFTGSRNGGLALAEIAAQRPEPIPVFAEMSSVNPVVLMPHALANRAEALGEGFAASLTLGAGQFCTNPGLVIALDGRELDRFVSAAGNALVAIEPPVMLTSGIHAAYGSGVAALGAYNDVARVASGQSCEAPNRCTGAIFETSGSAFLATPPLGLEVFGACSLIVRCKNLTELDQVVAGLEGQLSATLHLDPEDEAAAANVLALLREKAGRVLANGWPTGVEVTHAMVHGGPFPATTDTRTTSVGTLAMMRFLRPVCYQDMPNALLPPALTANNPWKLPRRIEGVWERSA